MKKSILLISSLFFLLFSSCQETTTTQEMISEEKVEFDEAKELEAIMNVINQETKCFFDGNYECWAKNWSHEEYAIQAWNNSDGTSDTAVGWESINSQGKNWIEENYKSGENIVHPEFKRQQPKVKFFNEKTAYLYWEQYNADKEKQFWIVSQETRIMEKKNDEWKIVNVSAFWSSKPKIPIDSLKI